MAVLVWRANKPTWARAVKLPGDWGGSNKKPPPLPLRHSVVRPTKPPCYDFDNKLRVTTLINWESLGVEMHG